MEVRNLSKSYQSKVVLENINFGVEAGQVKAILGPSGSGKSTLLRIMSLLESATSGQILLDGAEIGVVSKRGVTHQAPERRLAEQRTGIGTVFQSFNLFPHLSALDNVTLGPRVVAKWGRAEAAERAEALLERVGLFDRRHAFPSELSGGQQQRVAIARALVLSPKVMLFDEPTSALDPELVREVLGVMEDLARGGMTMVVVTHEVGFARNIADHVALFDEGRIVEESEPDLFFSSSASDRTQRFLQYVV